MGKSDTGQEEEARPRSQVTVDILRCDAKGAQDRRKDLRSVEDHRRWNTDEPRNDVSHPESFLCIERGRLVK